MYGVPYQERSSPQVGERRGLEVKSMASGMLVSFHLLITLVHHLCLCDDNFSWHTSVMCMLFYANLYQLTKLPDK